MATKEQQELINSEEFENALIEGAECNKNILTTYKEQNKSNFCRFSEIMYMKNEHIQEILDKKKKNRTDAENNELKQFKKDVSTMYRQTQDLIVKEENIEEGKKTKVEKIVAKITPVIKLLRYIGNNILENEFAKHGISLTFDNLETMNPGMNDDATKQSMIDVFDIAKNIKEKVNDDMSQITDNIFSTKVPLELQFDKEMNPSGIKPADFKKLVDLKTDIQMAKTDEDKEKVNDKIEKIATDKQFESARAELVRDTLSNLQQ